ITSSFTILIISSSLLSSHYVSQIVSSKQNKKKTSIILNMSSRRSRQSSSSSSGSSRILDDQIIKLVSKLHKFLPEIQTHRSNKASATKVLQETCNYIRSLNREVNDLSDRLSQLLSKIDTESPEAAIIRSLIM
ncbi:hypothetical protein AABB24_025942, partial [Solanum stoloniferum]